MFIKSLRVASHKHSVSMENNKISDLASIPNAAIIVARNDLSPANHSHHAYLRGWCYLEKRFSLSFGCFDISVKLT